MQLKNLPQYWGAVSQLFHWLIAVLIFLALSLGYIAHEMGRSPEQAKLFILHKSIGITVLLLVIFRVLWRLFASSPKVAEGINRNNERLAQFGQLCLYGLMFALPMTGWVINTAANIPFKWMDLFLIPDLPGVQETWRYSASVVHWYLSILLAFMVIGHGGMAILHHIKHKSNVLTRMLPPVKPLLFAFLFCVTLALLGFVALSSIQSKGGKDTASATHSPQSKAMPPDDAKAAYTRTNQQWLIMAEESAIAFVGTYDAIPFDGEFKQFSGEIYFNPEKPEQGYFDVSIDTGSITTHTDDWDLTLPEEDWFFVVRYPEAFYQSNNFSKAQNAYVAHGTLSLKGVVQHVPLSFTWELAADNNDLAVLNGAAVVKRTDFNIGAGGWMDDDTIGFDVNIKVKLSLQKKK